VVAVSLKKDEKWLTSDRQVGLTGKTVRPKAYIACGISGVSQHTMGMKDSKIIIAINKDRKAPIFEIADIGVIGDVLEVIPALVAQLNEEDS
jgi:electron transfer flavoprotein alpha subunit